MQPTRFSRTWLGQPAQSNVDVTISSATGFNPYPRSHFTDMSIWKKSCLSDAAAASYLGAIKASLQSPNMIIDLRIPQNQRYEQVVATGYRGGAVSRGGT